MGFSIIANCSSCRFTTSELFFGSGRCCRDSIMYPALSPDKDNIVMINIINRNLFEEVGYMFYDSEDLIDVSSKDSSKFLDWGNYKLFFIHARYLCPKCKKFYLRFYKGDTLWD